MAEGDLGSSPVFVDVDTGQQYAVTQDLLQPQDQIVKTETETPQNIQENSEGTAPEKQSNSQPEKSQNKDEPHSILHIQTRRIRCPECQRFTCETEEKMLRHIRKVHRGENPFQCYMCDYTTYNKSLFEEHVRIHQGIKPFKCSHCPYRSVSKKNTKKHELIHRPDNPLKCKQCGFIARHPRALLSHEKTHGDTIAKEKESQSWNECPNCPYRYNKSGSLRGHRKNRKKCQRCDHIACSKVLLMDHMIKAHNEVAIKKELFHCAHCAWASSNKPRILLHLIHHPNQTVDESVVDLHILRQYEIME